MQGYLMYICLIYFLSNTKCSNSASVSGVIDPKHPNGPLLLLSSMKKPEGLRSEGIFERFLRNFFDLMSTGLPGRKLAKYCRVLSRHLDNLEFKYTHRLAEHVRHISRMYRDGIRDEFSAYRKELDKKLPRRTEFLQAMNEIFTLRENQLFDDYIYELRNYGNGDKLFIDDETRNLLSNVIVGNVMKLSDREQKVLYKYIRLAVKEYKEYAV